MASDVYFSTLSNHKTLSPLDKIKRLLNKCSVSKIFKDGEIIAVKVHFGELGNTSFIRPIYIRPVLESLKALKTRPFLTDTNSLYVGMRTNSVDHLHNANLNGFNYSTLQVPIIIADGLRGENTKSVEVNLNIFKKVKLASDIMNAEGLVMISHFKGHEISGFGGSIKNLSMGCASRQGKLEMHSQTKPIVKQSLCTACARCAANCPADAIIIREKAAITSKCIGCARCISVCPEQAIDALWNETAENTQKKMIEYAYGVNKKFKNKVIYLNFLTSISPACDCYPGNDKPVGNDIGFLASDDPIALDKASFDLVIKEVGRDPFKEEYPAIDSNIQFEYAKKIGFGTTEYNLIEVE